MPRCQCEGTLGIDKKVDRRNRQHDRDNLAPRLINAQRDIDIIDDDVLPSDVEIMRRKGTGDCVGRGERKSLCLRTHIC